MSRLADIQLPSTSPEGRLRQRIMDLEARVAELEARDNRVPVVTSTPAGSLIEGRIMASDVGGTRKLWVVMNGTLRSVTLT